jgi:hypothetical protein
MYIYAQMQATQHKNLEFIYTHCNITKILLAIPDHWKQPLKIFKIILTIGDHI